MPNKHFTNYEIPLMNDTDRFNKSEHLQENKKRNKTKIQVTFTIQRWTTKNVNRI